MRAGAPVRSERVETKLLSNGTIDRVWFAGAGSTIRTRLNGVFGDGACVRSADEEEGRAMADEGNITDGDSECGCR